ncbi:MAG: hypothetical protein ABSB71_12145 [Candidatus Bathyarchaeia archaeon]
MQIEMEALIEQFAVEFVASFREIDKARGTVMPSTRQSIAIAKLLSARYMKNRKIDETDFIEAAVVTSFPKVQKVAEEIAKETLQKLKHVYPK